MGGRAGRYISDVQITSFTAKAETQLAFHLEPGHVSAIPLAYDVPSAICAAGALERHFWPAAEQPPFAKCTESPPWSCKLHAPLPSFAPPGKLARSYS
jgi:hypothetical protein